jgi:MoaA/NifB/PqqE/SkfB family radical SAM enzyme
MTEQKYLIYKNVFFTILASIDNGFVRIHLTGPASPLFRHIIGDLYSVFDGQHPAKLTEDTLYFSTWMPPIPSVAFSRLVHSQIKTVIANSAWKLGITVSTIPEQITISITEDCPNRCIHCALPDTKKKAHLTVPAVKQIIDQAMDMGTTQIIFDGGEPMMYEKLEELVAYVPEGAISTVFTSGSGLTLQKARALSEAGLYAVNISLDSPDNVEHDRIRGRDGVFNEAMQAVKYCLDAGLLVDMYVVVAPHNIYDLDKFYDLAVEVGVHELSFYEIVPTGRWIDHKKDILLPHHHLMLDRFVKQRSSGAVKVFSIPHVMNITGCFAGRRWLHVTPHGDVLPCACIPIPYGNIHNEPLKDIWQKIQKTGLYRANSCLMRDNAFREKYIEVHNSSG